MQEDKLNKLAPPCSSLPCYPDVYLGSQYNSVQLVDNKFAFATMVRFKDAKTNT